MTETLPVGFNAFQRRNFERGRTHAGNISQVPAKGRVFPGDGVPRPRTHRAADSVGWPCPLESSHVSVELSKAEPCSPVGGEELMYRQAFAPGTLTKALKTLDLMC